MPRAEHWSGRRTLRGRFVALAVPNVFASLAVPLAGVVDTAMLGRLPQMHDLAGVALASVLFSYVYVGFGFLRMGTTGLAAQAIGRRDHRGAVEILARAALVAAALGGALLVVRRPLAEFGFGVLDGSPQVTGAARDYFMARILGAPAVLVNLALVGWLLGMQRSRLVLVMTVVGGASNVGFDYLFLWVWQWGSAGAGYATMVSQCAMCAVGLVAVLPVVTQRPVALSLARVFERAKLREFVRLNRAILVRTIALVTAFSLFTNASAAIGDTTLASNSILLSVVTVAAFLIDGYAHATESLAGLFAGRGESDQLRALFRLAVVVSVVTGLTVASAFCAVPDLFAIFSNQVELLAAVERKRFWLLLVLGLASVAYTLDGYFIGLASGAVLSRCMLIALFAGYVPFAVWSHLRDGDDTILWAGLACFMFARAGTLAIYLPASWRPHDVSA